jgi:hypothetical protein
MNKKWDSCEENLQRLKGKLHFFKQKFDPFESSE